MINQKVWFITGASRGFGLEITKAALAEGNKVVATVRSKPEQLAAQLENNENLLVTVLDVTDEAQALDAAKQAIDKFGKIDVLVNNAGYGLLSAVEEASNEEVKQNYDANVFGLLNVTRAILPYMRKRRSGHVINISSVGGLNGFVGWGIYGSTKFAVEGITESMALELAPLGIYATVVAPGFFRTEFLDPTSLIRTAHVIDDYAGTVGEMQSFATQVNKKQPGDPKKLAQAFIKLANAEKPPVHLPLGNDTLAMYREKTAKFEKDIEDWYDVITGTDHDDVKG
ncbi:NAD(P)-dependent dehydrogenase (short-subunit alcohol dehydrogenase family) [Paenibacillus sp. V4I3]|uniref:oxidoreductase n=1 Tax=unclassified Paenibacillus TaxID=185978 RepID=UPI0027854289|nr:MULTISPECIES: oxidoreductase [unclassified Paenibacillus]MDQ0871518.1 NAD(P)-dependent dehydrogenase (short-subunit alcohol dehydrogenase family) [Paenibacillus sp. V4I3]MDQ0885171.1 NAD(P)-dependent dehydrogenase (short-subunit alcohol dehydrogenase family) [Paenibacillus sp. V4I9]